ncbi:MAG: dynamin family protein [Candidatus Hydrogenedentes bacterium]|nr:dynamin family protein [Candidatus Hydrogenedentota bacterium]
MSVEQHSENRTWTFQALDELEAFLEDDDFEGDVEKERAIVCHQRKELKEGKYRVVFLGEFNVGKSTLINALLDEDCLPTVIEECTSKITHVVRGDKTRVTLKLTSAATEPEIEALQATIDRCRIGTSITTQDEPPEVDIEFVRDNPRELLLTLRTLVTLGAEEDFPQLQSLRDRFEELVVHIPTDLLEEDLAFVDAPGVHSISETNQRITQNIIPESHLVICLLDSQNPGTEQNRDFIEAIHQHRHRKVFFVINKADQLNDDEIDPSGRRGPAKDLLRSLEGIVKDPELFFVSSLYARVAGQLAKGEIDLETVDRNNKIKIPYSVHKELSACSDPNAAAAEYLLEKSRFPALQQRVLRYLYDENREGAILESICRFLDAHSMRYARPLEVKLDIARNVPRLDELARDRERLNELVNDYHKKGEEIAAEFSRMSGNGEGETGDCGGYEGFLEKRLDETVVEDQVFKPLEYWLTDKAKFKEATKNKLRPVLGEMDIRIRELTSQVAAGLSKDVEAVENQILVRMGRALGKYGDVAHEPLRVSNIPGGTLSVGMRSSYMGYVTGGALLAGAAGAGLGMQFDVSTQLQPLLDPALLTFPQINALLGGLAGAVAGAVAGLVYRRATSGEAKRDKLRSALRNRIESILLGAPNEQDKETVDSAHAQLTKQLASRRENMARLIQEAFADRIHEIEQELAAVAAEERELKDEQERIVTRLEPKIAQLAALSERAREIARANEPVKSIVEVRRDDPQDFKPVQKAI